MTTRWSAIAGDGQPAGHVLPRSEFDLLAAGAGHGHGALRAGQLSKRILLSRSIVDISHRRDAPLRVELADAFALLAAAQRKDRSAVEAVLLSPPVGTWATLCLRQLRGLIDGDTQNEDHSPYLIGLAAAAAVRTGLDAEMTLRPVGGGVLVPTMGMVVVPHDCGPVRARCRGGALEIDGIGRIDMSASNGPDTPLWRPLRRLSSFAGGQRISVGFDDLDPYRDGEGLPVAGRHSPAEMAVWHARLDAGWRLLTREHPDRAAAIATGVRTLVPLVASERAPELSASSRDAFGAVALTCPADGLTMAGALVHEFQHTKLSALLDLVPLHERPSARLFYAPWRSDPRPLPGLLQGAYAYLGLCDFWQVHRLSATREGAPLAEFEFARWRDQVWQTVGTLESSGELTAEGTRFVRGMRARITTLRRVAIPARYTAFAQMASADHRMTWRLRHLRPDSANVGERADAWLTGSACPPTPAAPAQMVAGAPAFHLTGRIRLARLGATAPEEFDRYRDDPGRLAALATPATSADARYISGDVDGAFAAYREEIIQDPRRIPSWTGLALAGHELADASGLRVLATAPEELLALTTEIVRRTGMTPDPARLAAWLAGGHEQGN
ncbi:HEXXH motif domain-containing protein [Frankia sp. AgKG'84/4]|uniref:HEXXH motif domain-containing protein n=1 Tax=Frankia sp. AgKG'84/4 TaxID=573490 RepID=UPI00200D66B1|nr:HEXXH motif domain-containing protein [Frankia sp. AgKG'84/4]MCL9793423.1 HEXXH motif domain-containing protein [Frankia sp. AgKG'84/4]